MIYVYLYGRLGNNLFQIAQAISLAYKNNAQFGGAYPLDYWCNEPDNCLLRTYLNQYKNNILRNISILDTLPAGLTEIKTKEQFYAFDGTYDVVLNINNFQISSIDKSYLNTELIKSFFSIDIDSLLYIRSKYPQMFSLQNTTSIHVRRGDNLKHSDIYAICSISYFINALSKIPDKGFCFILTDDKDWCKSHLNFDNKLIVENEPPAIVFYIQTLCKNNIISSSTFSWWGAFLNSTKGKTVIAPWPWYGIALRKNNKRDEILPPDWIVVNNNSIYWYLRGTILFVNKKLISLLKKITIKK